MCMSFWACQKGQPRCEHQPQIRTWRDWPGVYVCAGRNSGAWDSKSPSSPAVPSPLPRVGWVPAAEKLWDRSGWSPVMSRTCPASTKESCLGILGEEGTFLLFPSRRAHLSKLRYRCISHYNSMFSESAKETLLPCSPPPWHASSWPLLKLKTSSLSSHTLLVNSSSPTYNVPQDKELQHLNNSEAH